MKLSLKNTLLAVLAAIVLICLAAGIASCKNSDGNHNYSSEWSYDDVAHWHACTDDGCDAVADYEEHTPADEGTALSGYYYYTCSVCNAEYRSALATYIVNVKNIGNAGVSGVSVSLYSGSTLVGTATSGNGGIVRFRNLEPGSYTATVDSSTIPTGYTIDSDDLNLSFTSDTRAQTIYLTPHLITETAEPSGITYSVGDVVYDHTFTTYYHDGSTGEVSLSGLLEAGYEAIVLQFFYTTCDPCMQEFPYINEVYNLTQASDGSYYYQKIAIIELSYSGRDTLSAFKSFVTSSAKAYDNLNYVHDSEGYNSNYNVVAFPTTVTIDRYGVVTSWDDGSQPTLSYWIYLFEALIGDDYTPSYITSSSSGSDEDETTTAKPDVDMPESGEIASTIVTANAYTTVSGSSSSDTGTFEFSAYSVDGVLDEYSWPWLTSDSSSESVYGVSNYIYSSNSNKLGTYAILVIDVKLTAGQVFMFDYVLSTEEDGDYLYVQVDTVLQAQLSGITTAWDTFYYMAQYSGYYQITLLYQKNTSVDEVGDVVYVSNMRLGVLDSAKASTDSSNDILDSTAVLTTADTLYNAATAYTLDGTQSNYYAGVGYKNYVSVYLATDGFYHVNYNNTTAKVDGDAADDDDPYLLADLYYTTPWNNTYSIWYIAYVYLYTYDYTSTTTSTTDDPTSGKGILYKNEEWNQALEDYAWIQNAAPMGYTLVDEYLATILKGVVQSYGTTDSTGTGGQYANENQWLEVCRYYVHYGAEGTNHDCKSLENLNLTYGIRMAEYVGSISSANTGNNAFTFDVNIPEVINPRGYYYSFEVETTGVYVFYTNEGLHDEDGYETDGETYGADPYIWITDSDAYGIAENDDYDLNVYDKNGNLNTSTSLTAYYNDNAKVYAYLKAGETYMVGCTLSYIYDVGSYDITVEYLGATYTYFTAAVESDIYTYSYDEDNGTYTYYLPYLFADYYLGDDKVYYAVNDDDTEVPIYINMTGITYLNSTYSSYTIEQAIDGNAWGNTSYDATMKKYLAEAKANTGVAEDGVTSLNGYVKATYELVELLTIYINGGDSTTDTTFADTAWLMTAYYTRTISSYTVSSDRVVDEYE